MRSLSDAQGQCKTKPHAEGSHTTRMPHAARHSRPHARRQDEAHALGSLLDTLHSPSDLVPLATAHRHSSQPEYTAPPSPLPPSSRIHGELSGRQRPEQQAPISARSAAQPPPPPEPPPAAPPAGADAGAGDMSGDATPSHRTAEVLRALQSLELATTDITEDFTEELALDLLSRVHILQRTLLQQLQRAHVRRNNFGDVFAGAGASAA